jgi:hypothetical protein
MKGLEPFRFRKQKAAHRGLFFARRSHVALQNACDGIHG